MSGAKMRELSKGAAFKQIDITRAAKGALNVGLPVEMIEVDRDGRIVIKTKRSDDDPPTNDWD